MKHKLLTLASAAVLFAACSDSSVSDANDEIKEKGTVTFFVYDALTRQPMKDASVYYRTTGKTNKTDAKGGLVWKGVDIGTSYFDITYKDYADIRHTTYVKDQIKHDVARVDDNTEKIAMYELGVNVKGKLYYIDHETKDWKPAAGVTVYVDYPDSTEIFPNEVYATTEEDGSYEFTNLAANVMFQVKSERFTVNDTIVYEVTSIDSVAQRKGYSESTWKELDPVAAEVASLDPVLLSSNLNKIGVKDELKLTFSEVLEKDSVTTQHINVQRIVSADPLVTKDVAVTLSLSEDGKTVSVKSQSGSWADGKDYYVNFKVWSKLAKALVDSVKIDGVEYKFFRKFTAGSLKVPEPVKNLIVKLDDDDNKVIDVLYEGKFTFESELDENSDLAYNTKVTVQWDALEKGVDKYNVYVKGDKDADADYIFVGSVEAANPDQEEFEIDIAEAFNKGKFLLYPQNKLQTGVITVMVLPENSVGEGSAKDAMTKEIKTFDEAKADIAAKQNNKALKKAEVKITGLYACTDENDKDCDVSSYSHSLAFPNGDYYRADLSIEGTLVDTKDYEGEYPDEYALYYKGADGWELIGTTPAVVAGIPVAPTFAIAKDDPKSPFKGANAQYKENNDKSFLYVIVPVFTEPPVAHVDAFCSDIAFKDKDACEAAYEVWTPEVKGSKGFTISPTSLDGKNGTIYEADDDLNGIVKKWKD